MKAIQKARKNRIIVGLESGRSIREVVALFDVSESYVYEVRKSVTKVLKNNVGGGKPKLSLQSQRYCTVMNGFYAPTLHDTSARLLAADH